MKKVLLTLSLFTLGVVFASANENCVSTAIDAYDSSADSDSAYNNMMIAYDECVRNGGHPGDTVVDL